MDVRLFLDSNVILSGLLSSKGSPKIILDLLNIEVPLLQGITGQYNLDEVERNLLKKFPEIIPIYREYLPRLKMEIIEVPPCEEIQPLLSQMSPKDAPVLASARIGKADYLITGDKKGFPKEVVSPIRVISPSDFLNKILPGLINSSP